MSENNEDFLTPEDIEAANSAMELSENTNDFRKTGRPPEIEVISLGDVKNAKSDVFLDKILEERKAEKEQETSR